MSAFLQCTCFGEDILWWRGALCFSTAIINVFIQRIRHCCVVCTHFPLWIMIHLCFIGLLDWFLTTTELIQSLFSIGPRPSQSDYFGVDPRVIAMFIYCMPKWTKLRKKMSLIRVGYICWIFYTLYGFVKKWQANFFYHSHLKQDLWR